MGDQPDLVAGEEEVAASDELLWRQVTKSLWDEKNDKPGSTAFSPSTADHGMPSFARESAVDAQAAQDWHQRNARSASFGVWAVSVNEVGTSQLRAVDDSGVPLTSEEKRAPGHTYIDYRSLGKTSEREIRAALLKLALARGKVETEAIAFVPLDEREDKAS